MTHAACQFHVAAWITGHCHAFFPKDVEVALCDPCAVRCRARHVEHTGFKEYLRGSLSVLLYAVFVLTLCLRQVDVCPYIIALCHVRDRFYHPEVISVLGMSARVNKDTAVLESVIHLYGLSRLLKGSALGYRRSEVGDSPRDIRLQARMNNGSHHVIDKVIHVCRRDYAEPYRFRHGQQSRPIHGITI